MYVEIKASSTGVLQASPSTERHSGFTTEKQRKHRDDLANVKQIPSVLPDYIPPLAGVVNYDIIPWDFKYTLITMYILKGIHIVGPQLEHIPVMKNNEFNLGDRKNYAMLAPHRYLMKMTGKKLHIVSQPWIRELAQLTILNVMKIPHFDRH
jgi:hypothetical protein